MLKSIGLKNVRLFKGKTYNFALPKLTVFCGTNSCGKSTILRSLLLLRQSQGIFEKYGKREGMLRFTGTHVDLGSYSSFVSDNEINRNIELSLAIEDMMPTDMASRIARQNKINIEAPRRGKGVPYTLDSTFIFQNINSSGNIGLENDTVPSAQGKLISSIFNVSFGDHQIYSWSVKSSKKEWKDTSYKIRIPEFTMSAFWRRSELAMNKIYTDKTISYDTMLDGLLPAQIMSREQEQERRPGDVFMRNIPYYVRRPLNDFTNALSQINYLAPLRSASSRYYLANYDITPDLDPRGEFLPYVLGGIGFSGLQEVENVLPLNKTVIKQSLSDALNGWLSYIRSGEKINRNSKRDEYKTNSIKGPVVEIDLKSVTGSTKHSIADSGFGYSQILPILVRGLIAKNGSTLIIEQPELHLNPALQVRLADFFIAMVRAGKQVIIETHSEHIVNTIRARSANENDGFISTNSTIYFLDIERGKPLVHELKIHPDGTVPHWPESFFGEAEELAGQLLRAQINFIKK
jgi:predicted ATPase